MRVLVTGGAGFIGGYVCDELHRRGHVPVIFDRHRETISSRAVMLGDTRDAAAVSEAVAHVDGVIHLAGVLGTQETISNPRPAAETNIFGGLNVLEACAQYNAPLVYIAVGNWFEQNTYSITKTTAERFVQMFVRYRDLRACSVRCFNVYGPGQSVAQPYGESHVRKIIPSFVMRALHGEPIEVYGDGQQVMDMIFAADAADVLVSALLHLAGGGAPGTLWEAGTGRATNVAQIAAMVRNEVSEQTGQAPRVEHLLMRPGETPGVAVLAEPSRLRELGLSPLSFVKLEDGLRWTIKHYRELL